MTLSLALALALAAGPAPQATGGPQDETAKGYAVVEARGPERAPFVGEPFTVRLRGGVDADVLEGSLVQPFRQRLDVPVQLEHPWFASAPPGLVAPDPPRFPASATASAEVALGAARTEAARYVERGPDDRRFTFVEVERVFVAGAAGRYTAPAPRMAFAYATEFREDLVAGRVPLDRHDAFVRGAPLEVEVRPLPEEDQPFSFTGAVGRFELDSSVRPLQVEVGETLQFVLTISGPGNLASVRAPRADRLRGFTLAGTSERRTADAVEVTYDLVAEDPNVAAVPPLEFSTFDPEQETYLQLDTLAFPVRVSRAAPAAGPGTRAGGPGPTPTPRGLAIGAPFLAVGLAALALLVVVAVVAGRRR